MKKLRALVIMMTIIVSLTGCGGQSNPGESEQNTVTQQPKQQTEQSVEQPSEQANEMPTPTETAEKEQSTDEKPAANETGANDETYTEDENSAVSDSNTTSEIRSDFKEAMDAYEAFYDEYCDFMKKYQENPTDLNLLLEYTNMLNNMADVNEKFAAWESTDLNTRELQYYLEVSSRVAKKVLEISQ
ncbi:MAG: hypothetical protein LUD54_06635 [Oscillospiraceae bacterium]|nr:hypothetical protein [Oscillospiraceae bacterium]